MAKCDSSGSEESGKLMALLLFPGDCSGAITKMKDVVCYLHLDYLKASRKSRSESSSSTCKQVTLEAALCRTQPIYIDISRLESDR